MELKEYQTVSQYASANKISVQAVYQGIKRGSVPSKTIGKTLLIRISD